MSCNGEGTDGADKREHRVAARDDQGVDEGVLSELLLVGGVGCHDTLEDSEREEDLRGGLAPDLGAVHQGPPVEDEEILQTCPRALQGQRADHDHHHAHDGQDDSRIDHASQGLQALEEREVYLHPDDQQTEHHIA